MEEAKTEPVVEQTQPKVAVAVDKKKMALGAALVLVIVLAYLAWTGLQPQLVAARVNGQTISRLEVIRELEKQGGANVLDSLISDRLLESKAASENVTISASDVAGEVDKLKAQLTEQGQTLDSYLASQHVTESYLENRLRLRLMLKRLLADKTAVTDADIDDFIKQNAAAIPKGTDTSAPAFRDQVRSQIGDQKFSAAADDYLASLRSSAEIQYVHKY